MATTTNMSVLSLDLISTVTSNPGDNSTSVNNINTSSVLPLNSSIPPESLPSAGQYGILPTLILLVLLTCTGNIIVIVCCRIEKSLRTVSGMYIVSLATADVIVGGTVMLGMLSYTYYGFWPLGFTLCTIWMCLDFCSCTISMLHLILVAHDRYVALVHPLDYRTSRTSKDALKRLGVAWVVGILGWAPAIVAYQFINATADGECFFLPNRLYVLIQSCAAYYIPIIIMVYCYAQCLRVLRQRYLKTAANSSETGTQLYILPAADFSVSSVNGGSAPSGNSASGGSGNEARDAVMKAKLNKQQQQLRSLRTLGVVMAVFLLCWLPFCLFWPITTMQPDAIPLRLYEASYWCAYVNSTINPFLYFLSNRDFRDAFKKLTKCQKSK